MSETKHPGREPQRRVASALEPRNPHLVLALRRAAGTHQKPEKSERVSSRIGLMRQLRRWIGVNERDS
jgi:hypothetical protein